ncbi:hypothetical protein BXZ70DRAFT_957396 [Cristinia sonorae]|uniref:Uncharacterized protein n=1 Tax=Cristinia sonorae TaxID=1940300 RepID=A0A8K0UGE0_9AGAR|nr:hypothetical protein BXZ70DRAFT_957396 [Cristinia sonorae]
MLNLVTHGLSVWISDPYTQAELEHSPPSIVNNAWTKCQVFIPEIEPLVFEVHVRWPEKAIAIISQCDYLVTVSYRRGQSPYHRVAHCRLSCSSHNIEAGGRDGILQHEADTPFVDGVFSVHQGIRYDTRITPRQRVDQACRYSKARIKVEYRKMWNVAAQPVTQLTTTDLDYIQSTIEPVERCSFDFVDWNPEKLLKSGHRRKPASTKAEVVVPSVSSTIRQRRKYLAAERSTLAPPPFPPTRSVASSPLSEFSEVTFLPTRRRSSPSTSSDSDWEPHTRKKVLPVRNSTRFAITSPTVDDHHCETPGNHARTSTSRDRANRKRGHDPMRSLQELKAESARLQEKKHCLKKELDDLRHAEKESRKEQREIEGLRAELEVLEAEVSAARKRVGL